MHAPVSNGLPVIVLKNINPKLTNFVLLCQGSSVTRVIPRKNVVLEVQVSQEHDGSGSDAAFPTSGYDADLATQVVIPKQSLDSLRDEKGEVRVEARFLWKNHFKKLKTK
jgi:hypothetical protein